MVTDFPCPQSGAGMHALTKHSPTALLNPWMLAVKNFVVFLKLVIMLNTLYSPDALLKPASAHDHTGDAPCSSGPGDQDGCHSWHARDYDIQKDSFCQANTPRHCTDSSLKYTPSLLVKKPLYISWSFNLNVRL